MQKKSKEIAEGTFVIDVSKETLDLKKSITLYTIYGSHDKLVDGCPVLLDIKKSDSVYAKQESNNNKTTYSIKSDEFGSLYNPLATGGIKSFKTKLLGENNKFLKVSKECFLQYLEFLKTKNVLHYKFADRNKQ